MKSPNFDETIFEPETEIKNEEEFKEAENIEIFSSHSADINAFGSGGFEGDSLIVKRTQKMQKFSLNNFGLCYSPTKTDLAKSIFLDAEGNQIKYVRG
jgi:hypothetical protein